ncbi:hypothetical protein [Actinacidiphila yeochonensis]|uniref:hypothetical protein n=1 Tax=Actinacidiphila yeochonensis TaxID=89050 RepID=UPI00055AE3CB|nr:hypothetical protein [Actinacidiphila yeochonensis]
MTVHSAWLPATGQTRADTRLTQAGATLPADPLTVQSGILPGVPDGSAKVAAFWLLNQNGMSATVDPGRAVIQGPAAQGAYPVTLSDVTPITFADNATPHGRIDLVCLRVYDAAYPDTDNPGQETKATLEIVKGEESSTPQVPATPHLALALYAVPVAAGASTGMGGLDWTKVQDLRVTTVAAGGVLPAYGNAAVPGAYPGQLRDLGNVLQRWDGTAWVPYPQAVGGIAPSGTTTGGYVGQYRCTTGGYLQRWDGTNWWQTVRGYSYVADPSNSLGGSTNSATYTTSILGQIAPPVTGGSGTGVFTSFGISYLLPLTIPFTAPASGAVLVRMGARIETDSATASGYLSVGITEGSTTAFSPSDNWSAVGSGVSYGSFATETRLYGMTPGLTYTATLYHRVNGSSANAVFRNRYLRIDPSW